MQDARNNRLKRLTMTPKIVDCISLYTLILGTNKINATYQCDKWRLIRNKIL